MKLLYDLLATYTAIHDHFEVTQYLPNLTQAHIHKLGQTLGLTLGLYHRHLKSMRDSDTFSDDMIYAWLRRGVPTWKTLVKALRACTN